MAGEIFHVPRTAEDDPTGIRTPQCSTAATHGLRRPKTGSIGRWRPRSSAIFGGSELARRHFLRLVGAGTAMAVVRSLFPLEAAKALAQEVGGCAAG